MSPSPNRSQVQLMAEGEPEVFPPGLAPTSEDYLGCFNDDVTDRVLTTVVTDDAMTLEVSASARVVS